MHTISRLAGLLIVGALVSAPALAAGKGDAKAEGITVNGQTIPASTFNAILAEQKAHGAPDTEEVKTAIREALIRRELLVQEAKKKGLDKKNEVQLQIEQARQEILGRAAVMDYVKAHPVSEDKLKKEYESIKTQAGNIEYKSRHVLVEKEDEAKAIIAKLDKGEKIADLAKQSKDPGSKDNGGDLGWSAPAAYVKPFADAIKLLKKGEYTKTPVKTDFGYHVILLEDSRPLNHPPYEQVKPQLQQRAQQQVVEEYLRDLRSKAKVN